LFKKAGVMKHAIVWRDAEKGKRNAGNEGGDGVADIRFAQFPTSWDSRARKRKNADAHKRVMGDVDGTPASADGIVAAHPPTRKRQAQRGIEGKKNTRADEKEAFTVD